MTSSTLRHRVSLPVRPSIENIRNQAKTLLKSISARDQLALDRLRFYLSVDPGSVKLADAQCVVAREHGYSSWPKLKAYIDSLQGRLYNRLRPFHSDLGYYEARADGLLSQLKSRLPQAAEQVRAHHPLYEGMLDDQIFAAEITTRDARLVTAKEHGYETWARFRSAIREIAEERRVEPFMQAFNAIESHDGERLAELIARDATLARACGTNGNTLLNLAVSCNNLEAVSQLVAAGADVNKANVRGLAPIHAAAYGNRAEIAALLLKAGAISDTSAHGDGGTPLVMALFWGHREVSEVLAARSLAPANLRVAAGMGNMHLMHSLFSADGQLTPQAREHRAFYRPHSGFPVWLPSDADPEVLGEAFVYAAKNSRIEALAFLLAHGANINGDPYRGTALTWTAAGSGDISVIEWLIDNGADVNQKATFGGPTHGEGVTALHLASQNGKLDVVKYLISRGADPNITDDLYGGNAIGHASHFGHTDMADYLRSLTN